MGLEEEKCTFVEHYNILAGEKAYVEEQVATLDGSVDGLAKQVETLVRDKGLMEE